MEDSPEVRVGTADRERALAALSEHFSQGRLEVGEFEERAGMAAASRTFGDLVPVFADLPGGLSAALAVPDATPPRAPRKKPRPRPAGAGLGRAIPASALLLMLLLVIVVSHGWLFFMLFPIAGAFGHGGGPGHGGHGGPGYHHR